AIAFPTGISTVEPFGAVPSITRLVLFVNSAKAFNTGASSEANAPLLVIFHTEYPIKLQRNNAIIIKMIVVRLLAAGLDGLVGVNGCGGACGGVVGRTGVLAELEGAGTVGIHISIKLVAVNIV